MSLNRAKPCVAMLVLAATVFCQAADKRKLADALSAVEANLKSAEGKKYDESAGKEFSEKFLGSLRQCRQTADGSDGPFDLLLKLDGGGKVQEALVYPETPLANCERAAMASAQFSPPPHQYYWINIHIQLKH
jgi:hypothetical protein